MKGIDAGVCTCWAFAGMIEIDEPYGALILRRAGSHIRTLNILEAGGSTGRMLASQLLTFRCLYPSSIGEAELVSRSPQHMPESLARLLAEDRSPVFQLRVRNTQQILGVFATKAAAEWEQFHCLYQPIELEVVPVLAGVAVAA